MELTETERLMLVQKKEEICELTLWILDNAPISQNQAEFKKKITTILSLVSTIASYTKSRNMNIDRLDDLANIIFSQLGLHSVVVECMLEVFCNLVNSIRFDFTRKDFKIIIPKIDLSIFRAK
ncbi:hypothetical protein JXA31_06585 [Candidatus Bathyarchaeota archaeon]|nr:hypothetical protein [Candidatus Bathyarchaeota archaeon]